MRNVLWSTSLAVRRKNAANKMLLFRDPEVDHGFWSKSARCAAPDILALQWTTGNVRGMLKFPRFREMVRPSLRPLRQVRAPAQRGNPYAGAFAVMTVE